MNDTTAEIRALMLEVQSSEYRRRQWAWAGSELQTVPHFDIWSELPQAILAILDENTALRERCETAERAAARLPEPPIANGTRVRTVADMHFGDITIPKGTEGVVDRGFPQYYRSDGSVELFGYGVVTDGGTDMGLMGDEIEAIDNA